METSACVIRVATVDDIDDLLILNGSLFKEDAAVRDPRVNTNWPLLEGLDYFRTHVASPASCCLVATNNGAVVGYLVGYVRDANLFRPLIGAELESMFISPDHRSGGIGGHLVEEFLAWSLAHDAEEMTVSAYAANAGALRFYERAGFTPRSIVLSKPLV